MTECEFDGRIREMEGKMYRIARSMLRSDADCADAMQNAVFMAWRKLPSLRDAGRFEGWLIRILVNCCRDMQREYQKRKGEGPITDDFHLESDQPGDMDLQRALNALAERQRLPILLHYMNALSVHDVARILHLTVPSVKGRIREGMKKLRLLMEADVYRMDPAHWLSEEYTVLNASGNFLLDRSEYQYLRPFYLHENYGSRLAYHETINREGQMRETARITIAFTLDADSAREIRKDMEMPDIVLENCTARYEKISISPLSTLVKLRLYPHENTPEALGELRLCYGCPTLSVPEGESLEWLQMESEGFACSSQDEAGRLYYEISFSWGGMMESPDSLCFSYEYAEETADPQTANHRRELIEKLVIPLK